MGNRPEKIGAKLFVLGQHRRLLLLPYVLFILKGQGALSQHRQQDTVLKGFQRRLCQRYSQHAIDIFIHPDGQIQAMGVGKSIGGSPRVLIIFKRPQSRLLFLFRKAASVRVFPALFSCGGKESRLSKASVFLRIDLLPHLHHLFS